MPEETYNVTITTPTGAKIQIPDLSFERIKELAGLNGHAAVRVSTARTISIKPSDAEPDYIDFKEALSDRGKKFIDVLRQHPNGLVADALAEKMGLQTPNQIGGVTGGGMAPFARKFGINLDYVYLKETTFQNGIRRTTYKPGKDIAKLQ